MRFSIDIPDELLRGAAPSPATSGDAGRAASATDRADAMSGGAAPQVIAGGVVARATEALSAGAAEEGGELAFDSDPFAQVLNGGAAPR